MSSSDGVREPEATDAEAADAEAADPEPKATDSDAADTMLNEYSPCALAGCHRQRQYPPGCVWDHCCRKCCASDGDLHDEWCNEEWIKLQTQEKKKQQVIREGLRRPMLMLKRSKAMARPKVRGTAGQMPGKCPGPDVGPLKKNARGTLMELRRRKKEIGREKKQLDFEEAHFDEAIALLEEEVEEDVEEEFFEEEEDEETISFTALATEEEAAAFAAEEEALRQQQQKKKQRRL
jgi:hypothetical protein